MNVLYLKFTGVLRPRRDNTDLKEFETLQEEVYPDLMRKGVITFLATIVLFILGHALHMEPG